MIYRISYIIFFLLFLSFKMNAQTIPVSGVVYDISGRKLSSNSVSNDKIDLSDLKTGNYILKLYTENRTINSKIVKE